MQCLGFRPRRLIAGTPLARAGWPRRCRVLEIQRGSSVKTYKRLDDASLSKKDPQVLWQAPSAEGARLRGGVKAIV
jgi:hypothetical protein